MGALEIAELSLSQAMRRVETSAQNLANMVTPGFKAHRTFSIGAEGGGAAAPEAVGAGKQGTVDFSNGKLVYLSDLKTDSVAWTPYFATAKPLPAMEQFYAPRFDRSVDSEPLRLADTPYDKGIALHSRTEIVYRLPAGYTRFQATVGIDDVGRHAGKVRLVVRGDDSVLLELVVAGEDPPKPIDLATTGVRRLTILADFADKSGTSDCLLLCNARLSK